MAGLVLVSVDYFAAKEAVCPQPPAITLRKALSETTLAAKGARTPTFANELVNGESV